MRVSVPEIRILRWMSGVTRKYGIRNEYVRGSIELTSIVDVTLINSHKTKL